MKCFCAESWQRYWKPVFAACAKYVKKKPTISHQPHQHEHSGLVQLVIAPQQQPLVSCINTNSGWCRETIHTDMSRWCFEVINSDRDHYGHKQPAANGGTSGTSGSMAHLHKVWNGSGEAGRWVGPVMCNAGSSFGVLPILTGESSTCSCFGRALVSRCNKPPFLAFDLGLALSPFLHEDWMSWLYLAHVKAKRCCHQYLPFVWGVGWPIFCMFDFFTFVCSPYKFPQCSPIH